MTVKVIAMNTFKEGIRARVLYNLAFFALLTIFVAYALGQLSLGEGGKVMIDFGLFSVTFFSVLIAIFVGIGLVYKEIEKRTIYTIISKPIQRWQFILGKYCGLCLILLVQLVAMWFFFNFVLFVLSGGFYPELSKAALFIYLELMVITAVAIFFSSFASPFLSALFTISFYVIGHSTQELAMFAGRGGNPLFASGAQLLHRFYNLDHFNIATEVVHGMPVSANWMFKAGVYAFALITLLILGSSLVFQRRDLK